MRGSLHSRVDRAPAGGSGPDDVKGISLDYFFTVLRDSSYGEVVFSADYRIGGPNPEALLCRPGGKGTFPAVVHNHGVGVDTLGYSKALKRGYNLPAICADLSAGGFLTFVPIRQGGPGFRNLPPHKAQVLEAIDYVKGLTDVDPRA
jgi:hypothetical protein